MTESQAPPNKPVAIFGAGGHGLLIGAVLVAAGDKVFFLDDRLDAINGVNALGAMIVGGSEKLEDPRFLRRHGLVVAIGNNHKRKQFSDLARSHAAALDIVIDENAVVFDTARLAEGLIMMAGAILSNNVCVGRSVIVNTNASVAHDCVIGDYVNICDGAVLTGGVHVGDMAYIGAGAVILPRVKIGVGSVVGAGAVVTKDVPDGITVTGNPAKPHHSDSEAVLPATGDNISAFVPRIG